MKKILSILLSIVIVLAISGAQTSAQMPGGGGPMPSGPSYFKKLGDGVEMSGGATLYMNEQSAAGADSAGKAQYWVKDDTPNTAYFTDDDGTDFLLTPGGGAAPANATYIVQTADATLTNEQAMGALGDGLVKNATTTGIQSIAVDGTDYISSVVIDTTPQLGGDLDANGFDIDIDDGQLTVQVDDNTNKVALVLDCDDVTNNPDCATIANVTTGVGLLIDQDGFDHALDIDLESVCKKNIAKLQARYPDQFSQASALNRDLDKERKILEET